ncbi:LarC family nickel insertion protein [Clostridium sp. BJN0001]|uniref:LarC family nickel insertion protein n=1 Tax=Clostridium sp. BJN0001 TaxID=2930219 RepID=UPI002467E290|nr:LarC family nickel insertion protein [Clostridium sp. BJN0001]
MSTLYLDAFSGISGDMFIAAMLDIGADFKNLETELKKLNLSNYKLYYEKKSKNSIFGSDFDVILEHGEKDCGISEEHNHHHHHHHGRNFADIKKLIEESTLSDFVKSHSISVFLEIAKAEAKVHNKTIDDVHFHEVGAIDSIIDIVGSFICLEELNIEKVISSPLTDGCGHINIAHGEMPVPVPAVMQMRVNSYIPVNQRLDIHTELITPTGLGIVKDIVSEFGSVKSDMEITNAGYGFGKRETGCFNALRVLLLKKK